MRGGSTSHFVPEDAADSDRSPLSGPNAASGAPALSCPSPPPCPARLLPRRRPPPPPPLPLRPRLFRAPSPAPGDVMRSLQRVSHVGRGAFGGHVGRGGNPRLVGRRPREGILRAAGREGLMRGLGGVPGGESTILAWGREGKGRLRPGATWQLLPLQSDGHVQGKHPQTLVAPPGQPFPANCKAVRALSGSFSLRRLHLDDVSQRCYNVAQTWQLPRMGGLQLPVSRPLSDLPPPSNRITGAGRDPLLGHCRHLQQRSPTTSVGKLFH